MFQIASIILWAVLQLQEPIRTAADGRTFEYAWSGRRFVPLGANYAPRNLLLEDHWDSHWDEIETDFAEMRRMHMTVVRVHLQFDRFMRDATTPNAHSLRMLRRLIHVAEQQNLYLDLTGLACYRPMYVPLWYDQLDEEGRWAAQERFWTAIARTCRNSNAIFCYDLLNEPLVSGTTRKTGQWYSGAQFGGFDFLQFINLDASGRERPEIARIWTEHMARAIRAEDPRHMITVGLLPCQPDGSHFSGFEPLAISPALDFMSVHIYPETSRPATALLQLRAVDVGKPVVIEETFPLNCSITELETFLGDASDTAAGVIGHYFGEPIELLASLEQRKKASISQILMLRWLELAGRIRPNPKPAHRPFRIVAPE